MKMSNRQLKVANRINLALVEVFSVGKGLDFRLIDCKITVTNVLVSPDLKVVRCYVLPFGNNSISGEEFMDAIEKSKVIIRKEVTKRLELKYSPELRFFYDYGFVNAEKVNKILNSLDNSSSN